jgi:iron(III) transport system permease protein
MNKFTGSLERRLMELKLREKVNSQYIILVGCILVVAYLVLVPLFMLLFGSIRSAPIGEPGAYFTIKNYLDAYLSPRFFPLMGNSFLYGMGTCLLTFFLGTSLAWVYERTNTPFKKIFGVAALIPFIVPGILSTISWILLLSPKIGLINLALMKIFNLETSPLTVYSLYGMIWAESVHLYPLVFMMMAASFHSMDMALEESSTMSGASIFGTFCRVTFPLMRPAFFSAMLIMFIRAIEGFEVPALVGLPAGIEVFTSEIYLALHEYPSNFGLAGSLAVTLLVVSTVGVYLYRRVTSKGHMFATVTGKGFRPRVIDLGKFKYVVSSLCIVFFLITIGLPIFILLWSSFVPFYEVPSLEAIKTLSLKNYVFVFGYPTTMTAFRNSIFLMLTTATITMLLTSVIAWIAVKSKIKGRGLLDTLAFIPIAFPGIVLGVSLLYVYLALPIIPIYGTIWILLIAYITKYMPYGIRTTSASIIQIHSELEEASALSGAPWGTTFFKITLPLLIPGFMAGWVYIAMISLRELSTSILLYSSGSEVLSIVVFDLWEGGQYPTLCALGIMMIGLLIILATVANKVGAKLGIKRALE